ncbi:MAG TPA: NUDIX domain-containing protein [Acidobacteriaceae bacterium]|nr:NUDIX domain-containing protein [Acidobacteriaceae bacterium]
MTKTPKRSAGLLMYRKNADIVEVFLVHPGGPYWSKKNEGYWTIPKGEYDTDEQPLAAAIREFQEETGFKVSEPFVELGSVKQKTGKIVIAWAFEGNCDPTKLLSNTCEIEWPPRSGKKLVIPEVDRGRWFSLDQSREFVRLEQVPLLDRLSAWLA